MKLDIPTLCVDAELFARFVVMESDGAFLLRQDKKIRAKVTVARDDRPCLLDNHLTGPVTGTQVEILQG